MSELGKTMFGSTDLNSMPGLLGNPPGQGQTQIGTTGKTVDPQGINHPKHYNMHPSGLEVCEVTDFLPFNLGNVFKYSVRHDLKDGLKDLGKNVWYAKRAVQTNEHLRVTEDQQSRKTLLMNLVHYMEYEPDRLVRTVIASLLSYIYVHGTVGHGVALVQACEVLLEVHKKEQENG